MGFGQHGLKSADDVRECDDWVEEYMRYVEYTEPPLAFHRWTAIGCISAALQRRVNMPWGMERIYPNLYIVLLGPAAQTRKSTALKIGEDLVKQINIPIIGQDNSPEAIIRAIKLSITNFEDGSNIRTQSAVCCFASELAVFLGQQRGEFQAFLTDWWDSPDDWKRTTKHQGTDDITGMCFTLIGAMAPDWIPHIFTPESIGGGFTSRIIFVPEHRKARTIVNPNKTPPPAGSRDVLIADLARINRMVGEFHFTKEAEAFYENWYASDDAELQDGIYAVPDRAFHTYCGRRSVILRKVAMCVSAGRGNSLEISISDIKTALGMLQDIEKRLPGTFAAVGRSSNSAAMAAVSKMIMTRKEVLRSSLLGELYQDITASELDEVEKTLEAMQRISVTRLTESGDTRYRWIVP